MGKLIQMDILSSYSLLWLAGKSADIASMKKIIEAAGGKLDEATATAFLSSVKDKELNALIKEGQSKLQSIGGGAAASGPVAATAKVETKKEEKKEEVVEDVQLGGGLFGDDDEDW